MWLVTSSRTSPDSHFPARSLEGWEQDIDDLVKKFPFECRIDPFAEDEDEWDY